MSQSLNWNGGQNVIRFQPADRDGERQRMLDEIVDAQAQMLYRARALWIGGNCLAWGLLTNGQRETYRKEIHELIKGAQ
jgi:hypothetical protein